MYIYIYIYICIYMYIYMYIKKIAPAHCARGIASVTAKDSARGQASRCLLPLSLSVRAQQFAASGRFGAERLTGFG